MCHKASLAKEGDYIRVLLGDSDLFVCNISGVVRCFVNKCPHRGARIVTQGGGATRLICPYHGWVFREEETIVPRSETFADSLCKPKEARLEEWLVEEVGQLVFVANKPYFDLDEQIEEGLLRDLKGLGQIISEEHCRNEIMFTAPWQVAVENALESYHINKIHGKTLVKVRLDDGVDTMFRWSSLWQAQSNDKRIELLARLARGNEESNGLVTSGYSSVYLFPFSMISTTGGLSFSFQLYQPTGDRPDRQTVLTTSLYTREPKSSRLKDRLLEFYDSTATFNHQVFQEDADICGTIGVDSWSSGRPRYHSRLEDKIVHFRDMCRAVERTAQCVDK